MSYAWRSGATRQTKQSAFNGKPPASARKVANNTFSYTTEDGCEVFRLHKTDVVTRLPDGRIKLDSGGWKSVTTKDRMNLFAGAGTDRFSNFCIFSGKGGWRVARRGEWDKSVAFYDGMILPDALDNPSAEDQSDQREAEAKKLKKEIATFAKLYEKGIPMPGAGDCWLCKMPDNGDTEHLRDHMREGYAHGTLAVNAMRWAGHKDDSIRFHVERDFASHIVVRAVRRYLQFKLGLTY